MITESKVTEIFCIADIICHACADSGGICSHAGSRTTVSWKSCRVASWL